VKPVHDDRRPEGVVRTEPILPDHLLDIGYAFWKSKALLSAVELGIFSELARQPMRHDTIVAKFGLHGRGVRDFLDALVALNLLHRHADGLYINSPEAELYLDRGKPTYIGDLIELLNARLYHNWSSLTEVLRTGKPSGSLERGYPYLYQDQSSLGLFLKAMTAGTLITARELALKFPWSKYRSVVDVGTAEGCLPVGLALVHPNLTGGGFDLPFVKSSFEKYVLAHGLDQRLTFYSGDFLTDALPDADVLVMGRVLHNWDLQTKKMLMKKASTAVKPGGALVVYDKLIDDDRCVRAHSLLASVNMLIETPAGFEYTAAECIGWMEQVGFRDIRLEELGALHSAVIGFVP
jgi:O-methyltransferase domain/Dimerisation domain